MSYTHRWTRSNRLDDATWERIRLDAETALQLFRVTASDQWRETGHEPVQLRGPDGRGGPVIAITSIAFNGDAAREASADAFVFPQDARDGSAPAESSATHPARFTCNTELHPYDVAVCTVLLIAKHHLGEGLELQSDGAVEEFSWPVAREVAGTVLRTTAALENGPDGIRWRADG